MRILRLLGLKRLALTLFLGLVVSLAYFWTGLEAHTDSGYVMPQPDTYFYCQAARRIVEGHPFSYSEGTAVSTGTTSVLYPFVLAVPYALGCTGDDLLLAGWAVNALFFLVALVCWWYVAERRFRSSAAKWLMALLLPLMGQLAYCFFDQSDIGFLNCMVALTVAAFASERRGFILVMLVLLPWVRPEGMMLSLLSFFLLLPRPSSLIPVVSALAVFGFNYLLTGEFQFSSVAHKGYFKTMPFLEAFACSVSDACDLARAYLFGWILEDEQFAARRLYFPPLIFAAFMWLGVFVRRRNRSDLFRETVLMLAVAASFASVASSGWQGTNMDRYVVWSTPFLLWYFCEGAAWLLGRYGNVLRPIIAVPVLFIIVNSVMMVAFFKAGTSYCDRVRGFYAKCEAAMEKGASIGAPSECHIAYALSPRRVVHGMGIYSPELFVPIGCSFYETLKHEPEKRFDYWFEDEFLNGLLDTNTVLSLGTRVVQVPKDDVRSLIRADWSVFDAAAKAPRLDGWTPVIRVDVGYAPDERAVDFEIIGEKRAHVSTLEQTDLLPSGIPALESYIFAKDGVAMTVPLCPGKDAEMLVRVLPEGGSVRLAGFRLRLGERQNLADPEKGIAATGFSELRRRIPAAEITPGGTRIVIPGPIAVCSIWFYQ